MFAHYHHKLCGCAKDLCEFTTRQKDVKCNSYETVLVEVHTGIIQVESIARKKRKEKRTFW